MIALIVTEFPLDLFADRRKSLATGALSRGGLKLQTDLFSSLEWWPWADSNGRPPV
jgi:hypothetical protein